jgi:hypothetical protein
LQTFLVIKHCERTNIGKGLNLGQSPIYLVLSILFAPYSRQNDGITPPLHAPAQSNLLYIVYSPTPNIFGWLSCDYLLIGGQFTLPCFYFYYFCIAPFNVQNNWTASPCMLQTPRASFLFLLSPLTPTFGWLLCLPFKFRPL